MAKKKLFTMHVSDVVDQRIRSIQKRTGCESMADVVRQSLALHQILLDAQDSGRRVLLEGEDGDLREVLMLPLV